jgi:hypothetical protein
MEDQVTLVDERDNEVGVEEKMAAHRSGKLHRAVSVFIFDSGGRLLLQKRSLAKYHSGGLWSNTCCGHPRPDENRRDAHRPSTIPTSPSGKGGPLLNRSLHGHPKRHFKRKCRGICAGTDPLVFLLLLAAAPAPLHAERVTPFAPGERLTFALRWSVIPAGEAVLEVLPMETIQEKPQ